MKKPIHLLLMSAALATVPFAAQAGSADSSSGAVAQAGLQNSGNSRSYLSSANRTTVVNDNALTGGGGIGGNGSGSIIHNTPDVGVASYAGAANNCGAGGAVGLTGPGAGATFSWAGENDICRRQSEFVALRVASENLTNVNPVLSQMYEQTARGLMCQNEDVRRAASPGFCVMAPVRMAAVTTAAPPPPPLPAPAAYQPAPAAYAPPPSPIRDCSVWHQYINYYRENGINVELRVPPECEVP